YQIRPSAEREVLTANPYAARALGVLHKTLAELAEEIVNEKGLKLATPLTRQYLLQSAAAAVLVDTDPISIALAVMPTLEKIFTAGIDLTALAEVDSVRGRQLAGLADTYRTGLRQAGLLDPSEVFWQASLLTPSRRTILVYGYPQLDQDELVFLDTLAGEGSVIRLFSTDHPIFIDCLAAIEFLERQGWQVERTNITLTPFADQFLHCQNTSQNLPAYVYGNLEAEVRGVLAQVKALLSEGVAIDDIVLVTGNESLYFSTVLAVAWEYSLPVRIFYEIPLSETKLGSWLRIVSEAILDGLSYETTLRLLTHWFGSGLSEEQRHTARKQRPNGARTWQKELGIDLSAFAWPLQDTRIGWVRRLTKLFQTLQIDERARLWEREVAALAVLRNNLAILSEPAAEIISLEAFIKQLHEALTLLKVAAEPTSGIELHLASKISGARYRHVFVMGMAEQIMPEPVQDDYLLDFYERKLLATAGLHLQSAAQAARREAVCFWALLQTATDTLTLSYPKLIGSKQTLPSCYFNSLGVKPIAAPLSPLASIEEARRVYLRRTELTYDPVMAQARHAWTVEYRREGPQPYDEYDGAVGVALDPAKRVFSASQLTALGQCPFKWFASYLLGLEAAAARETELAPSLLGNLYHRTLELALSWVKGTDQDLRQAVLEQLEEALLEAERLEGLPPLPARVAHRKEDLQMLRQAVMGTDFLPPGAQVLGFETRFQSHWRGLAVIGYLDRIDRTVDGLVLIDYKTSASTPLGAKTKDGKAKLDVQLPLYIQAAAPTLFPGEKIADAYYYSLTKAKVLKRARIDEGALEELVARVIMHLEKGHYPVAPDSSQQACGYCPFDLVCRRGPRLSRKGIIIDSDE
ncbi:MAG: PD-(D/E)XK nuclease family protein, partial [Acidobacteriota bacterium]